MTTEIIDHTNYYSDKCRYCGATADKEPLFWHRINPAVGWDWTCVDREGCEERRKEADGGR